MLRAEERNRPNNDDESWIGGAFGPDVRGKHWFEKEPWGSCMFNARAKPAY